MRHKALRFVPVLVILLLALTLGGCGTGIPSGHRGVFFSTFGDGTEFGKVYDEGFNFHMPWNKMFVYQVQVQERKESLNLLSSDGATIKMDVSILFRPVADKLDSLQVMIGPDYYDVAVAPNVRGIARGIAGRYVPEEIYSTKREELSSGILRELQDQMAPRFVIVENVLIRDVFIPDKISEAINFKLTAAQEAQKMEFTIQTERLEADRKRIEAQGIADFQKIVSAGITPAMLKWKGIEATQKIAESPNTKIILVGNDANNLPLILSGSKD